MTSLFQCFNHLDLLYIYKIYMYDQMCINIYIYIIGQQAGDKGVTCFRSLDDKIVLAWPMAHGIE